jgi:argininosuccinate lyase
MERESWWVRCRSTSVPYNRNLQEDKEPLFDSIKQVLMGLAAMNGAYRLMTFRAAAADD